MLSSLNFSPTRPTAMSRQLTLGSAVENSGSTGDNVTLSGKPPVSEPTPSRPRIQVGRVALHTAAGVVSSLGGPLLGMGLGALTFGVLGALDGARGGAEEMASGANTSEGQAVCTVVGGGLGFVFGGIGGVFRGAILGLVGGLTGPTIGGGLAGGLALAGELVHRYGR
ncbi:MAG: hypothetical protein FJX76_11315 [Armatimonadetes bacterium]|nr:hypothetical protein [Armatimonadota bacterium]